MTTSSPTLWDFAADPAAFGGLTVSRKYDFDRLSSQLASVYHLMADGNWRTLTEIQAMVGGSEAAISARLRDLRKPQFGGHRVDRQPRGDRKQGLWEYRLILNGGNHASE